MGDIKTERLENYISIVIEPRNAGTRCHASVYRSYGRWGDIGQCHKKATKTFKGHGFCTIHMKQIERKMVIKGETKTDNMKRIYRVGTSRYSQVIKFGFAKVIDETPKFYKIVHGKGLFAHQDKIDKSLVQATNANEIVSKGISVFRKRIEQLTQEIKEAEEHIDFLKTILGKTEDEIKNALDAKFSSLN